MFKIFKKKDIEITDEQVKLILTIIDKEYEINNKGLLKEMMDIVVEYMVKVGELEKRISELEKRMEESD